MPSNVNSSRSVQLESATSLSGASKSDVTSSIGQIIQQMPSFSNNFVMGMKLGYTGVKMTSAPSALALFR